MSISHHVATKAASVQNKITAREAVAVLRVCGSVTVAQSETQPSLRPDDAPETTPLLPCIPRRLEGSEHAHEAALKNAQDASTVEAHESEWSSCGSVTPRLRDPHSPDGEESWCETTELPPHSPLWLDCADTSCETAIFSCETATLPPFTPQWLESVDDSWETITLPPCSPQSVYDAHAHHQSDVSQATVSGEAQLVRDDGAEDERVSKLLSRLEALEEDAHRRSLQLLKPLRPNQDDVVEGLRRSISARFPLDAWKEAACKSVAFSTARSYSARQLGDVVPSALVGDGRTLAKTTKAERPNVSPQMFVDGETSLAALLRDRSSARHPTTQLCPHLAPAGPHLAPAIARWRSSSPSAPNPHKASVPQGPSLVQLTATVGPLPLHNLTSLSPPGGTGRRTLAQTCEASAMQAAPRCVNNYPSPRTPVVAFGQARRCAAVQQRMHCAGTSTPRHPAPQPLCWAANQQSWACAPNACVHGRHPVYRSACAQGAAAACGAGSVLSARGFRFC